MGSLRNKEQLQTNLTGKFYHTKGININLAELNIVKCNEGSDEFTKGEFNIKPRWVMERIFDIGRVYLKKVV